MKINLKNRSKQDMLMHGLLITFLLCPIYLLPRFGYGSIDIALAGILSYSRGASFFALYMFLYKLFANFLYKHISTDNLRSFVIRYFAIKDSANEDGVNEDSANKDKTNNIPNISSIQYYLLKFYLFLPRSGMTSQMAQNYSKIMLILVPFLIGFIVFSIPLVQINRTEILQVIGMLGVTAIYVLLVKTKNIQPSPLLSKIIVSIYTIKYNIENQLEQDKLAKSNKSNRRER